MVCLPLMRLLMTSHIRLSLLVIGELPRVKLLVGQEQFLPWLITSQHLEGRWRVCITDRLEIGLPLVLEFSPPLEHVVHLFDLVDNLVSLPRGHSSLLLRALALIDQNDIFRRGIS